MRGSVKIGLAGALVAFSSVLGSVPVAAQGSYSPYDETPSAAMARYIRNLAADPKDFDSLIGAGRAALALDDPQAAAGFFARADDVDPRRPEPQAGMGAVSVANGDPQGAIPYFKRALQLGASLESIACDRGLAYDLLGQQAQAQADYRLALGGRDADEARKRFALSLAISGNRNGAIQILAPLSAKGDPDVARVRAFVLALTGDPTAAMNAAVAAMPGRGANAAPFLERLSSLSAAQKAAAVNLGIFPDGGAAYAYASSPPEPAANASSEDRLAGIDGVLRGPPETERASQPPQEVQSQVRQVQASYVRRTAPPPAPIFHSKLWLQLASGENVDGLASQFRRMKDRNPEVFEGITGYVARNGDSARLIIGPFRGESDAAILADDLETLGIDAFKFTNSESDRIAPLPVE